MSCTIFLALVWFLKVVDVKSHFSCLVCDSIKNGVEDQSCPIYSFADSAAIKRVSCKYGACYNLLENINGTDFAYRGCTNDLKGMPYTLPAESCYGWKGKDICICYEDECNIIGADNSYGKELDDHLKNARKPGEIHKKECYQCLSFDPLDETKNYTELCPKYDGINEGRVYKELCNNSCFIRSYKDDPEKVARGCTDTQWGLPEPLPVDGCYNLEGAVWCICSVGKCNARPLGKSSGKDMYAHLEETMDNYEEPDGKKRCYECINYGPDGTYYKQCPKNSRVRRASVRECNGTCFTRSYDFDHQKVARGCSDTQWGLPDPLPPDGCYKWYSEVWCVCSKTRCNGKALGVPKDDTQFDARPEGKEGSATSLQASIFTLLFFCCVWDVYMF